MPDFSVLFVDDEPITRKLSSRLIGRQYPVLEAVDGFQAIEILNSASDQVGVIVTDMKMDRMDGLSLIEIISDRYPQIAIIASTGDRANYDFDELVASGKIVAAVEKPWELTEVLVIIGTAMAARTRCADDDQIL